MKTASSSIVKPVSSSSSSRLVKTFVLDTNVLIHDPEALFQFQRSRVVLPLAVIEELDHFKHLNDERGYSVRQVSRFLDRLRSKGKLSQGVTLEHGGHLVIEYHKTEKMPHQLENSANKKDNEILSTALWLKERGERVVLISKDMNLRIKAEVLELETEDYEREKVTVQDLYKGWREMLVEKEIIDQFFKDHQLKNLEGMKDILPNEFVILKAKDGASQSGLARYQPQTGLVSLFHTQSKPWGIRPLNVQQKFALDLLLDKEISLVSLMGVPGSGKTLLALAAGLEQVFESSSYRRMLISRPVVPVGRDIGFLPGTKEEKLSTWMGAVKDNIEFLCDASGRVTSEEVLGEASDLFNSDKIEVEAVSFLRGRSLPKIYFIIDDAQNLTPHEVKTIISRAGEGTKVVLTGDPYQIDNPYLDASSNGLSNLVDRFKGQKVFGTVKFDKIERSTLAALASELL
ncbi:MAG: PhoH family protein [Elusimicrobia bacterium]|nr:PhoH family protein [Elusimicrobiota bacterium]